MEELYVTENEINFCDPDEAGNYFAKLVFELLTTNTALKSLHIQGSRFDKASMNNLGRLLPHIHLKRIIFDFYDDVSVEVISDMARGLLGNDSLLVVTTNGYGGLQGEQRKLWNTHVDYVTGRNQMRPLLVATRNENAKNTPQLPLLLPLGLWPHLIGWASGLEIDRLNGRGGRTQEAIASLLHTSLGAQ